MSAHTSLGPTLVAADPWFALGVALGGCRLVVGTFFGAYSYAYIASHSRDVCPRGLGKPCCLGLCFRELGMVWVVVDGAWVVRVWVWVGMGSRGGYGAWGYIGSGLSRAHPS